MRVIVVGAGVAGLSIGWRLCQAGVEVTILERGEPVRGATWASAGMIAATAELGHEQGPEAEFARRSSGLWPVFAAEIEQATGVAIHYAPSGALIVALDAIQTRTLKGSVTPASELSWLTPSEAAAMEPMLSGQIEGALWTPGEAFVDNRALGRALVHAFARAGGVLSPTEPVVEFIIEGVRMTAVRTPFRTYQADAFIVAAGAWSGQILGLPAELTKIKPIKGEMLALERPPAAGFPGHLIWGNGIYLVPRRNQLLVGATVADAGFDTRITDAARDHLRTRANVLMPALSTWNQTDHWAGLRPGSPDGLPLVGPTTVERLFAATGQYRNGILFAPAIAEAVTRLVLDQRMPPQIAAFDPTRFA
jgi:glycine oxidase